MSDSSMTSLTASHAPVTEASGAMLDRSAPRQRPMTIASILIGVAAILAVSVAFSMVGQGGGTLYVPILVALGMTVHDAATTSLFVIVATSVSAAIIYRRRRIVDWKLALAIEPPTIALAFVGGLLANSIDATVLKIIFAGVLILAAVLMLRPAREQKADTSGGWGHWHRQLGDNRYVVRLPGLMPVTAAAGFVAGMIGISGGIFKLPAMVLIGRVPIRIAIGTSSLMVALTALSGFSGHLVGGSFNVVAALPLAAAAFAGGRLGSNLSIRVNAPALRVLFAIILLLTSVWMIVSIFVR
jgi:uncharacterized membrane protein YfcA